MQYDPLQPARTTLIDLAATANPVYIGEANSVQPTFQFTVTSVSKANPAVFTITAHGLQTDNVVTIAGATGDWAALNGSLIIIVLSANTFSVAVDSTGFAGSFAGTVTTIAPRTSASCWRITKNYYDGNSNLLRSGFAGGGMPDRVYDNRATLQYT